MRLFSLKDISRLLNIPYKCLIKIEKAELVVPFKRDKESLFDFKGVVAFRTIKELYDKGLSINRLRQCLQNLKKLMPSVYQPFSELKISQLGNELILSKDDKVFTSEGQFIINFEHNKRDLITLFPKTVDTLFFEALEYEEKGFLKKAKEIYSSIIKIDSEYVNAYVNLGNIYYWEGDLEEAEDYYIKALRIDPNHPEANYNLANLLEERGDIKKAILFYIKAIYEEPSFADAHFNLARLFDKVGEKDNALKHWRIYLSLEPYGKWADYVRKILEEMRSD
ncbi:MAG: tetratricopeptide repeat protein [Thermodesulfovibrio sp.]|nr:tetratricopeptide repeat protein [Thermodesulfovibrio sp.]